MYSPERQSDPLGPDVGFNTTRWSVVVAAGQGHSPDSREALEKLCKTYWYPLYSFVRRRGHTVEEAEDLTQAFFERFLEKSYLNSVEAEKGRFRSFLLVCMKHFLANERERAQTQRRGGKFTLISFDAQDAEDRYAMEPKDHRTPEAAFERRWAETLLATALLRVRDECDAGKHDRFEQLKMFLVQENGAGSYAELSARMGLTEVALRSIVHRLRKRYGELVRAEIADTVTDGRSVDEEMRYLFEILGN